MKTAEDYWQEYSTQKEIDKPWTRFISEAQFKKCIRNCQKESIGLIVDIPEPSNYYNIQELVDAHLKEVDSCKKERKSLAEENSSNLSHLIAARKKLKQVEDKLEYTDNYNNMLIKEFEDFKDRLLKLEQKFIYQEELSDNLLIFNKAFIDQLEKINQTR